MEKLVTVSSTHVNTNGKVGTGEGLEIRLEKKLEHLYAGMI